MSDAVLIACITNLAIVISRVLSHLEHRGSSKQISEIHAAMNGKDQVG